MRLGEIVILSLMFSDCDGDGSNDTTASTEDTNPYTTSISDK